jgi:hypothetical protein
MAKNQSDPKPKKTKGSAIVASTLKVSKDKTIDGGTLKEVEVKGYKAKPKEEEKVSYGAYTEKNKFLLPSRPQMSKEDYATVKKRLLIRDNESDDAAQYKVLENMDLVRKILKEKTIKK